MADYWDFHAGADLDAYVETVLAAKQAGLPVVMGLEVDYYRGRMDQVAELLAGYPFDVLLGSVHWIGAWRFDDLDDGPSMAEWSARSVDACWDAYTEAIEELAAQPDVRRARPPRPDQGDRSRAPTAPASGGTGWPRPPRSTAPRPSSPRPAGASPWPSRTRPSRLLARLRRPRRPVHHRLRRPPPRPRRRPGRRPPGPARLDRRRPPPGLSPPRPPHVAGPLRPASWPPRWRRSARREPQSHRREGWGSGDAGRAGRGAHGPRAGRAGAPPAAARVVDRAGRPLVLGPAPRRPGVRDGRGPGRRARGGRRQ